MLTNQVWTLLEPIIYYMNLKQDNRNKSKFYFQESFKYNLISKNLLLIIVNVIFWTIIKTINHFTI